MPLESKIISTNNKLYLNQNKTKSKTKIKLSNQLKSKEISINDLFFIFIVLIQLCPFFV